MAVIHFSSRHYPRADRLEASSSAYAAMAQVELIPRDTAWFHLDARIRLLPGVSIARVRCSPMRVRRGPAQVADGNDDVVFLINTAPRDRWVSMLRQRGEFLCGLGEACVVARDIPGYIESRYRTHGLLSVSFSRASLTPLLREHAAEPGRRLPAGPSLSLLRNYALSMLAPKDIGEPDPVRSAAHLHDLATLVLGGQRDAQQRAMDRGLRAARLRAIKADLAAHARYGDLSLDWLAGRHGVSPSYVRVLFNCEGTSFTDYLLELRLQRVFAQLSNPRYARHSISTIVYDAGFNNLSWFYRAFKRRYGLTPGDVRER
ncbi:hypothetical protein CAI21_17450 [Alkalilimnicola ehrlichii]|nr:AraC family transcriptional regulator [Alkalilimnicola ehrlichii]RFA26265.1 hypothetical protein CAI21_17450 [Alkalilimnicola ehrlichii]